MNKICRLAFKFALILAFLVFPALPVQAEQSFMMTPDGANIFYEYLRAPFEMEKGTVILLHGWGMSYTEWDGFKEKLNGSGWSTLAIELRGHGASLEGYDRQYDYREINAPEEREMLLIDVFTAASFLLTDKPIWIAGSSIGANYALRYASGDPRIHGVILLAPGYDSWGILKMETITRFGNRPILMFAAHNNPHSYRTCMDLKMRAQGAKAFFRLSSGHGKNGFRDKARFAQLTIDWMNTYAAYRKNNLLNAELKNYFLYWL